MDEGERPAGRSRLASQALIAAIAAVAIASVLALSARAQVTLTRFTATPQTDRSIRIEWEMTAVPNSVTFSLYRADNQNGPWDTPLAQVPPVNAGSSAYGYVDPANNVTPGTTYYYKLQDNTGAWYGPVTAVVPVASTATATATTTGATATATRTRTPYPRYVYNTATPLPTDPPTATRRFTNTPKPPTAGPATQPPIATARPIVLPTVVRATLGPARITTPTPNPQAPAAIAPAPPTAAPVAPAAQAITTLPTAPASPTELPTSTATVKLRPSATPSMTATPAVFAAKSKVQKTPTTTGAPSALPERAAGPPIELVITIGVVGLLALLGGIFVVRRRSRDGP